jgi:hypothetical protein
MFIAGVTESLVRLLQTQLEAIRKDERWSVLGLTPRDIAADRPWRIGWLLWRAEAGPAPRNTQAPQPASPGLPVILHYLLLVRGKRADDEHEMLGRCMATLAATPVLAGPQLAPGHAWPDGTMLQVAADQGDAAALLGIWQSLAAPLQLSVPYTVRGLSLAGHTGSVP